MGNWNLVICINKCTSRLVASCQLALSLFFGAKPPFKGRVVTSNGGNEEKVAKSNGAGESDGGGRKQISGVHTVQSETGIKIGTHVWECVKKKSRPTHPPRYIKVSVK